MVLTKVLHGHSSARVKYFHCFGGKLISSIDSHCPDDDNERTMGWEPKQPPSSRSSAGDRHKRSENGERSENASTNPSTVAGRSVIICATFLTSQRCTAVSIDTRNAVAKFRRQFWNYTCFNAPPGFAKPLPFSAGMVLFTGTSMGQSLSQIGILFACWDGLVCGLPLTPEPVSTCQRPMRKPRSTILM